ncbi:ATP-dependent Clp protease ATP-binding subunit [Candidatus Peregrinibacteria bacterium]|nr:ATP-dependent Clp protease ATP-binding subunit [Candidatus Peregrinibacteria bacterium]
MFFSKKSDNTPEQSSQRSGNPTSPTNSAGKGASPQTARVSSSAPASSAAIDQYFSDSLRRVLIAAGSEAKTVKAPDIDTEHLLLGLLMKRDQVMEQMFEKFQVRPDELEQFVRERLNLGKEDPKKLTFSPRAKQALLFADEERRKYNHHATNPEHLLLALIREGEGVAAQTLKKFGIEMDLADSVVESVVGHGEEKDVLTGNGETPCLDQFGEDLCAKAREGKLDPVIGRSQEIERTVHILARRRKNNPVLIGEPGVGKTAIVEGLAFRIVTGNVPDILKGKRIVAVTINSLLAGASKRGEFEERLQKVIKEVINSKGDVILFIDEIHTLISEGSTDAANILKPPLARGELHCIGATTTGEYHQYIEEDAALERRFQPVTIPEPSVEETYEILQGVRDKYEAFHKVKISDEILKLAVKLSDRFVNDRFLPDKAFDLIDEASVMCKIPSLAMPENIKKLQHEIERLKSEEERAKQVINLEEITRLEKAIEAKQKNLEEEKQKISDEKATAHDEIQPEHLQKIISRWTGVPIENLSTSETEKLMSLQDEMHKNVIGQEIAINALAQAVRRSRAGIKDPTKPIASFLFMGPTGVGKTEVCKVLALNLFGTKESVIRFDMSEFMEKHAVSRLLGPPPGYVGYEKGGELTEAVRKHSYSIVLFDEVEKANPDVFNILLQILDDGRVTDNHGRLVSFKNTIIVCTSNLASKTISEAYQNGVPKEVDAKDKFFDSLRKRVLPELKQFFRPELINRFEDVIFFEPLTIEHIVKIVDIMIAKTKKLLAEKDITLHISNAAKKHIAENGGFDPEFGARPLQRAILRLVENPLSDSIIMGEFVQGDHVVVDAGKSESGKAELVFKKGVRGMDENEGEIYFTEQEKTQTGVLGDIESAVNSESVANTVSSPAFDEKNGLVSSDDIEALKHEGLTDEQIQTFWKQDTTQGNMFVFQFKNPNEFQSLEIFAGMEKDIKEKVLQLWNKTHPDAPSAALINTQAESGLQKSVSKEESEKAAGLEKVPVAASEATSGNTAPQDFEFVDGHIVSN